MREFVFPDPSLTSRAGQFVWLAINIEDEKNAPFLVKFPGEAVPTFAVVDPKDESVALRLVGSMTVPQLHAFLDRALVAVGSGGGGGQEADAALRAADQHYGARRYKEAEEAYRLALDKAPAERAAVWASASEQAAMLTILPYPIIARRRRSSGIFRPGFGRRQSG